MACTLSILGRCFLKFSRVETQPWGFLKKNVSVSAPFGEARTRGFRYYYRVAWRSTELASHLVPPQLPVY